MSFAIAASGQAIGRVVSDDLFGLWIEPQDALRTCGDVRQVNNRRRAVTGVYGGGYPPCLFLHRAGTDRLALEFSADGSPGVALASRGKCLFRLSWRGSLTALKAERGLGESLTRE